MNWAKTLLMLLSIASLSACVSPPIGDGCLVFGTKFRPSPNWKERLTQSEKRWALAHNVKVDRFCGKEKSEADPSPKSLSLPVAEPNA